MRRVVLLLLALSLAACGPSPGQKKDPAQKAAKAGRKCPDPDLRDKRDPCSPMYLPSPPPRAKREPF